jgi:thioesterase domain-containing protein
MARLLKAQSREVAFLGLWDTYPPGPLRQASLPDRIMIHLNNLRSLGPGQVLGYFNDRWISLLLRASTLALVRSVMRWINFSPKDAMVAATISRNSYAPPPYPGDLFLFVVRERNWYVRWNPMENWPKYVQGNLEIREVQGEHRTMLFEPHVQDLAHKLNECLKEVEGRELKEFLDQ